MAAFLIKKRSPLLFGVLLAFMAIILVGSAVWFFWPRIVEYVTPPEKPDHLTLSPARFSDLDGWQTDNMQPALIAFQRSCERILRRADDKDIGPDPRVGTVAQWRPACETALEINAQTVRSEDLRVFFQTAFKPWRAGNNNDPVGLFTGYYEPELRGSLTRHDQFQIPLYLKPDDMVDIDLGAFRTDLKGQKVVGRVTGKKVVPYYNRTDIEAGALADRGLELVWVDDAVDAFFLQIQGSGRVVLDDGNILKVGYAATNGQAYFAIGRELIKRGALTPKTVSLQTIRQWLHDNPDQADDVMNLNASYVFFRQLPGDPDAGPIGAQGVPLETERSLAVDRRFHAMGVPIWLETRDAMNADRKFHQLMIAQDTGGAIRGPVRGDIFFGPGEKAALHAGHMNRQGQTYLLLPAGISIDESPLNRQD
ncbi:murein transglycosylase A [Thalassospira sp. MCCC 1A01428]|uniref:murein transglycosylase A n=1 Tax=Thalassospira sp. MCCC 1A01428 TaxID=1470575 RepID=UPI000A1D74F8|nr:murein transglycosylase A [Thalassospira sp. MCCC 1A01428]